jgi:hypothetical protein
MKVTYILSLAQEYKMTPLLPLASILKVEYQLQHHF